MRISQVKPQTKASVLWGTQVHGLRLGLAAQKAVIQFYIENTGATALNVLSHVSAGEMHLDWYTLSLQDSQGDKRLLHFVEDRNKSAVVEAHLEPGASLDHTVDLAVWALRPVNGQKPLLAGRYQASAVYDVPASQDHWSGRMEVGPITLTVPAH